MAPVLPAGVDSPDTGHIGTIGSGLEPFHESVCKSADALGFEVTEMR
jgi:hypothetical protein